VLVVAVVALRERQHILCIYVYTAYVCILIKDRYLGDAMYGVYVYNIVYDDNKYARRYLLFLRAARVDRLYVYSGRVRRNTQRENGFYGDSASRTIIFFLY